MEKIRAAFPAVVVDWDEIYSVDLPATNRLGIPYQRAAQEFIQVQVGDKQISIKQDDHSISSVVWDAGLLTSDFLIQFFIQEGCTLGRVVDIGCGTGVTGMVCCFLNAEHVVFTDNIETPTLAANLKALADVSPVPFELRLCDWFKEEDVLARPGEIFDMVVCR